MSKKISICYLPVSSSDRTLARLILDLQHQPGIEAISYAFAAELVAVASTIRYHAHPTLTRFIEVKTTNGGSLTTFIISQNELEFSEEAEDAFCLYRVFQFSKSPQLFIVRGDLTHVLHLEALDYRARLKAISR